MGDRLEHRLHVGARPFLGAGDVEGGTGIERQAAIEGDEFADIGGDEQPFEGLGKPRPLRPGEDEEQAGGLVDRPAARVPPATGALGGGEVIGIEDQIRLAEPARHEAERDEQRPLAAAIALIAGEPLGAGEQPRRGLRRHLPRQPAAQQRSIVCAFWRIWLLIIASCDCWLAVAPAMAGYARPVTALLS